MSGAVKRRNGEEETIGINDANHVGKVRKKEADSPEESPRPTAENQVRQHGRDNFLADSKDKLISTEIHNDNLFPLFFLGILLSI